VTAERRLSNSASLTSCPRAVSSSTAPASICQTSCSAGASARADSTTAPWVAFSTTATTASESVRIHWTWDGEEVS
jgi:hypothetical protein